MAANKAIRLGPTAVANAVGNLFNAPTLTGGVNPPATSTASYYILRHIRIVNKTAGAVTFSGYIGATGGSSAGTEFLGTALSVAANSYVDWYGALRLDTADFLTGVASAATSLTIEAEGEIGVA
tara:strand:- start:12545 stop:12916 length:372 start_codon:yes stop_codon:yes gene_type:complete